MEIKYLSGVADQYELILLDIWGVLLEGKKLYPGVAESVKETAEKTNIVFFSNSPRLAPIVANNLAKLGISSAKSDNVITAGDLARKVIIEKFQQQTPLILHIGDKGHEDLLQDISHHKTQDVEKADILLLSLHLDEGKDLDEFDHLFKAAAKRQDLLILCANPDTIIPCGEKIRYCPGYFAKKIEDYGGHVTYTGKPEPIIYEELLRRYNQIDKRKILMVGDTFETDILGANRFNIASGLVLTGNSVNYHRDVASSVAKARKLSMIAEQLAIYPDFIVNLI